MFSFIVFVVGLMLGASVTHSYHTSESTKFMYFGSNCDKFDESYVGVCWSNGFSFKVGEFFENIKEQPEE